MHKKHAFIFALIITCLIISNFLISNLLSVNGQTREKVIISKITDGDTLKLSDGRIIRLLNINSPEKGVKGSELGANFLNNFVNRTVEVDIIGTDKYKRNLARIYSPDYLNLAIVEQGFASKFLVQDSELSLFAKAEESAIKSNLGIWKRSNFSDCFNSNIDKINEKVIIKNSCQNINFKGWTLKDESRKTYYFKDIAFNMVILHSGSGNDNSTDLFWNNQGDIWNNDRDSLYLFDSDGGIVHYETYGY